MNELLIKYNLTVIDLPKIFPQENGLFEEHNRLKKLVENNPYFQGQLEKTESKITTLLTQNEDHLAQYSKAISEKPEPKTSNRQPSEFYSIETTMESGKKNRQEEADIDKATELFNEYAKKDVTVVMKKVVSHYGNEKAELLFQHTAGATEPMPEETPIAAMQEIIIKDEMLGKKFKNVKFSNAQKFIKFLYLAGASRQWHTNGKYSFWLLPQSPALQEKEYIITTKEQIEGAMYLMVKNSARVAALMSILFDMCETHTDPVSVYESDTKDAWLQFNDTAKPSEQTEPEPVSGIPYLEIDEAIAFLNKLDFDKLIALFAIKKLHEENESYRGANFHELIMHRSVKKISVEIFGAKQIIPDKNLIAWLARKHFLNAYYEPEKVTENIIALHGYCFSLGSHPFSRIAYNDGDKIKITPIKKQEINFTDIIEYYPCAYLPGVKYENKFIIGHDNLIGHTVFYNSKNDNIVFVSSSEYNHVFENCDKGGIKKFYFDKAMLYLYVTTSEETAYMLKTEAVQPQLLLLYNGKFTGGKLIAHSDFITESDILTEHDKPEIHNPEPANPEPATLEPAQQ